jgi:beta-mannanase
MGGTMSSRAADFVKMWRHVWRVFHKQGVKNVLWVWSPNIQSKKHAAEPNLSEIYPGDKYVDWVGIDGYYYDAAAGTSNNQTFNDVFKPTITQINQVAPKKPWIVAETGVAAGTHKPAEITNLINAVANRSEFNGFVYFNQYKGGDRSDWRFDAPGDTADLNAFKAAIANHAFANGKPGTFTRTH